MSFETSIKSRYSDRTLYVGAADDSGDVEIHLVEQTNQLLGDIFLRKGDMVNLAIQILKDLDPEVLAPPRFVDLPNGTFLRRILDGLIVRVIPTPKGKEKRKLDDNNNWVAMEDGQAFVAVQDANDPAWAVLDDDQVEVKATWRFKA